MKRKKKYFLETGNAELDVFALTITGWMEFHTITIHSPYMIEETILSLIRSLIPIFKINNKLQFKYLF